LNTRFANLPDGVELTPRGLHIAFQGREEFLQRVAALVFALQNDTDRILAFVAQADQAAGRPE
jgi:hypothetical protein